MGVYSHLDVNYLNENQIKCIELLSEGRLTKRDIAKQLGVSERSIYGWMKQEHFLAALHKREDEIFDDCKSEFKKKLPFVINEYYKLCFDSDKRTREIALRYWMDRAMGKMSSQIEVSDNRSATDDFDINAAVKELSKSIGEGKIIPLAKVTNG